MFAIHFIAFTVFYLKMDESTLFYFYGAQAIYLGAVLVLFRNLYPRASKLLVNNMCMLITIGFIMLTRISYDQSMKQFKIPGDCHGGGSYRSDSDQKAEISG
ncbi:MAG: hypothetical protein ACLR6B_02250 [Blautia sp.]